MKIVFVLGALCAMLATAVSQECEPGEFLCDTNYCIPSFYVCDGYPDCRDGTDEPTNPDDCPACRSDEFRCNNGRCIDETWVCDTENDCIDGSDEKQGCPEGTFTCEIGGCIPESWTCDSYNDCYDYSDESESVCVCADNEVRCPSEEGSQQPGECIPEDWVCDPDGICDCNNGCWDESNCNRTHPIKRHAPKPTNLRGKNKAAYWHKVGAKK